jgi:hypothetical protein
VDLNEAVARLRSNPRDEDAHVALHGWIERLGSVTSVVADHRQEAIRMVQAKFMERAYDQLLPDMDHPAAYIGRAVYNASVSLHRKASRLVASPVEAVAEAPVPDIDPEILDILHSVAETAARQRDNPQNGELLRRSWREMCAMAVDGLTLREAIVAEEPGLSLDALERATTAAHKRHQRARGYMHERIDAKDGRSLDPDVARQARWTLDRFFRRRKKAGVRSAPAGASGGHDATS